MCILIRQRQREARGRHTQEKNKGENDMVIEAEGRKMCLQAHCSIASTLQKLAERQEADSLTEPSSGSQPC
jgi:hypothetical protein